MKNILWTFVFVALTGSALAVHFGDKKTLTFSTKGPDLYADKTPVLDNEKYALVYVSPGATFDGFYTDGSLVNTTSNQLMCTLPVAKGGKCPKQIVDFSLRMIKIPKGQGGTNVVVMLDTRVPDPVTTNKLGELVMGWGIAGETEGISDSRVVVKESHSRNATHASKNSTFTADVTGEPPVITGIEVKGETVFVSVKNVSPNAVYALHATDDIKIEKSRWNMSERKNHKLGDKTSRTVVLEYPVTESAKLFQVFTPPRNTAN